MKGRIVEGGIKAGLVVIAVLCVVGLVSGTGVRVVDSFAEDRTRLLVVDIGGFSWASVLAPEAGVDMPCIGGFLAGNSAYGDVTVPGSALESETLGFFLTGRFSGNQGIVDAVAESPVYGGRNPARYLVWERIHSAGQPVAVVGFPIWHPLHGRDAIVIPSTRFFPLSGVVFHDGMSVQDPSYTSLIVNPNRVPDALVKQIREGLVLPDAVGTAISASLADDLTITAMAERSVRDVPGAHTFVSLRGLAMLDNYLHNTGGPSVSKATRNTVLRRYHCFVDSLIQRLDAVVRDGRKAVLVFSLDGNPGFFAATGKNIRRTVEPLSVQPVDITITLLYLAGAPIPVSMDGVILFGMLNDDFYFKHPFHVCP